MVLCKIGGALYGTRSIVAFEDGENTAIIIIVKAIALAVWAVACG